MAGGHRRANPHGPIGGRKGPGDVLSESIRGRRGMFKVRRSKGPLCSALRTDTGRVEPDLNSLEKRLVNVLSRNDRFSPPVIYWDDLVRMLEAFGFPDPRSRADDFIRRMIDRVHGWFNYIPFHSLSLRAESLKGIREFVRLHPEAS